MFLRAFWHGRFSSCGFLLGRGTKPADKAKVKGRNGGFGAMLTVRLFSQTYLACKRKHLQRGVSLNR
jgi:hypothetical protein